MGNSLQPTDGSKCHGYINFFCKIREFIVYQLKKQTNKTRNLDTVWANGTLDNVRNAPHSTAIVVRVR